MIRIVAFGDVHGNRFIKLLSTSAYMLEKADIILLAGDILNKGRVEDCKILVDLIDTYASDTPVYGVFGNEEYDEIIETLRETCSRIKWLYDEAVHIPNYSLSIIGTRGVLDKPTFWQRRHIPNIYSIYSRRLKRIEELIRLERRSYRYIILLTHYAPICETLKGEPEKIWSQLGSSKVTRLVKKFRPDIVIHAHAHRSIIHKTSIDGSNVYNVSLPATKKPVEIYLTRRTLEDFFF